MADLNVVKYSVGICTYNRALILKECLDALLPQVGSPDVEVIVINNNSSDTTSEILSVIDSSYFRVVDEPLAGLSNARNRFLHEASGDYLIFLDDDAIPSENWLDSMIKAFESNSRGDFFGGRIVPDDVKKPVWFGPLFHPVYSILDLGCDVCNFPAGYGPVGANMAISRRVLGVEKFNTNLGRVGDSLLSGEETELFQRLGFKSEEAIYLGTATVIHKFPVERYSREWAVQRYQSDGESSRALLRESGSFILGVRLFMSYCYQFIKSFTSVNKMYIYCRLVAFLSFIK